jgi:hypothetical protein
MPNQHFAEARADGNARWTITRTRPGIWWESAGLKSPFLSKAEYAINEKGLETQQIANNIASDKSQEASISYLDSDYSNGNVIVKELSGLITVDKQNILEQHGALVFRLFTIKNENEESEPLEEELQILTESKIVLKDGKVNLSGIFNEKNVTYNEDNEFLTFIFNINVELKLEFPVDPDDLWLEISSDLGNLQTGNPKPKYDTDENTKAFELASLNQNLISTVEVKILGNPVDKSGIKFTLKSNIDSPYNIRIFDFQGNIIYEILSKNFDSDYLYEFNEKFGTQLNPGLYFLRISNGSFVKNTSFVVD